MKNFHVAIINYWVDYISEFFFYFCHSIENHGLTWEIFSLKLNFFCDGSKDVVLRSQYSTIFFYIRSDNSFRINSFRISRPRWILDCIFFLFDFNEVCKTKTVFLVSPVNNFLSHLGSSAVTPFNFILSVLYYVKHETGVRAGYIVTL